MGGEGGLTLAAVRRAEELGRLVPEEHQCNKHLKQLGKRAVVFYEESTLFLLFHSLAITNCLDNIHNVNFGYVKGCG